MSVVGIDFGTANCVAAVARRRGVDIVANEASRRETPCLVAFREDQRVVGEGAATSMLSNLPNTISNIKRFIGRKFSDETVQKEIANVNYKVKQLEGDDIGIEVDYQGETQTLLPEQIVAMMLNKMKDTVEIDNGRTVKVQEVVLSVPNYFNDAQRRALLDSAHIAGLNVFQLLSESAAAAIPWGMYRKNLPEDDSFVHVLFVNFGEATFSASVVGFSKTKLSVLSSVSDPNIGGRDFDAILYNYFNKIILEEFKLDISKNKRAQFRLTQQCERVKRVLTTNPEAPFYIESLMNDLDVRSLIKREQFEAEIETFLDSAMKVVQKAVTESGIGEKPLDFVEIVGNSSYNPRFQQRLQETVKVDISQSQNKSEAVARGCALQCAILSPQFHLNRTVVFKDYNPYSVRITYTDTSDAGVQSAVKSAVLFKRGDALPSAKRITFPRASNVIDIEVDYPNLDEFPIPPSNTKIGKFQIQKFDKEPATTDPEADLTSKVEVKFKLNESGIFSLVYARAIESYLEADATPASPAPTPESAPAAATEGGDADTVMTEAAKKKRKTRTSELTVDVELYGGLSQQALKDLKAKELAMQQADHIATATADSKNALESYSYDLQSKIGYDWVDFATEEERNAISTQVDDAINWLYGEGDAATKEIYDTRLNQLHVLGDPVALRVSEFESRDPAIEALRTSINLYKDFVKSTDEKYAHISAEDRQKVTDKINETEEWLEKMIARQNNESKSSNPVLLTSELQQKTDALARFSNPIMNKSKPPPPKPEPAKEAPKPDAAAAAPKEEAKEEAKPADATPAAETTPAESAEAVPSDMDVD